MSISAILSWMLCGLVVGIIARVLVPEKLDISLLLTMVLGIAGAVLGGLVYAMIQGAPRQPLSISGDAWHGWIVAILGAVVVLWGYRMFHPRRWWQ